MKTKGMTKQEAIKTLALINRQCDFNNELKKAVREESKRNPDILLIAKYDNTLQAYTKQVVNGWNDAPSPEMMNFIKKFIEEKGQFLPEQLQRKYISQAASIFGGTWSVCVNTYLRNDAKDLEKYIEMLEVNELSDNATDEEAIEGAKITRENGRLNVDFGGRVDEETYKIMRSNGFLYSPRFEQFTRQLTPNAEYSLKRVINALKEVNA